MQFRHRLLLIPLTLLIFSLTVGFVDNPIFASSTEDLSTRLQEFSPTPTPLVEPQVHFSSTMPESAENEEILAKGKWAGY